MNILGGLNDHQNTFYEYRYVIRTKMRHSLSLSENVHTPTKRVELRNKGNFQHDTRARKVFLQPYSIAHALETSARSRTRGRERSREKAFSAHELRRTKRKEVGKICSLVSFWAQGLPKNELWRRRVGLESAIVGFALVTSASFLASKGTFCSEPIVASHTRPNRISCSSVAFMQHVKCCPCCSVVVLGNRGPSLSYRLVDIN